MKKKILSVVLCVAIILGTIPFLMSSASTSGYLSNGEYVYSLNADGDTSDSYKDYGFGTTDADGQVWTDKSVTVNADLSNFDVTLSAVAQEYTSTLTSSEDATVAVDVMLIIDKTWSMQSNNLSDVSVTRAGAMIQAINQAIDTIMEANSNNRVALYAYAIPNETSGSYSNKYTSPLSVMEILPLGHYTSTNSTVWPSDPDYSKTTVYGKYIDYNTAGSFAPDSGIQGLDSSYNTTTALGGGTNTQYGVLTSADDFVKKITAETETATSSSMQRYPFVLLLTDDMSNVSNKNWFDLEQRNRYGGIATQTNQNAANYEKYNALSTGYNGDAWAQTTDRYEQIYALSILACAYAKDQILNAYSAYNTKIKGKAPSDLDVEWFNIGIGTDDTTDAESTAGQLKLVLSPELVAAADETDTSSVAGMTKKYIAQYTSQSELESIVSTGKSFKLDSNISIGSQYEDINYENNLNKYIFDSDYTPDYDYLTSFSSEDKYVYVDDHIYYTNTSNSLTQAFTDLANEIEDRSRKVSIPVYTTSGSGASSNLIFTDYIGEGMLADNFVLTTDDGATKITGVLDEDTGVITFEGYTSYAVLSEDSEGNEILTWYVTPDEIPLFTYKDYKDISEGYNDVTPIRLTYSVTPDEAELTETSVLYSNLYNTAATATAAYTVCQDNPFYFDITTDSSTGKFASSTQKSSLSEGTDKDKNVTETADKVVGKAYATATEGTTNVLNITDTLGNNGKLDPILKVEKSVNTTEVYPGDDITYTITVTKLTEDDITDTIVIKDSLPENGSVLPDYKSGDSGVTNSGSDITITLDGIDEDTVSKTYTVTTHETDNTGDVYTADDPVFSSVATKTFSVTPEEDEDLDVTISAKYDLTYSWSGDVPSGAALPASQTDLTNGTAYTIDTTYVSGTHYFAETDAYGNETSYYVFSGWDKSDGTINGADVAATGTWTKVTPTVSTWNITYSWTGLPDGETLCDADGNAVTVTLPADSVKYTNNSTYPVDETYTSASVVYTKNSNGNINASYTFSGWGTPEGATGTNDKGESTILSDLTIRGSWTKADVDVPEYGVTYNFSGKVPAEDESGNTIAAPIDKSTYEKNENVPVSTAFTAGYTIADKDDYGNTKGTYTFKGWTLDPDAETVTYVAGTTVMPDSALEITGVWEYTANPDYKSYSVTYDWGTEVPSCVTLPTNTEAYPTNSTYTVDPTYTASTTVYEYTDGTSDTTGDKEGGVVKYVWTFSGWTDPGSGVMGNSDVTITGSWTKTEVEKKTVTYVFDGDAPTGVTAPDAQTDYPGTTVVKPTIPTTVTETDTDGTKYIYTITWTEIPEEISNTDTTVTGTWTKTEAPKGDAVYSWTGAPSSETIPGDITGVYVGDSYTVDTTYTAGKTVEVKDEYGNVTDTYVFSGWTDSGSGTMRDGGTTITGEWTHTASTPSTWHIAYSWTGLPDGETLYDADGKETVPAVPTDSTIYTNNQPFTVNDSYTSSTVVYTQDDYGNKTASYTFSGWGTPEGTTGTNDKGESTILSDLDFKGTWTETANDVDTWKVTYTYTGDIPAAPEGGTIDTVPAVPADKTYTNNQPFTVDETVKAGDTVKAYDEFGNVVAEYTFSGWNTPAGTTGANDKGESTILSDLAISGEWTKTEKTVDTWNITYSWTTADGSDLPEGIALPEDGNSYVNNQPYTVDTKYTSSLKIDVEISEGVVEGTWTFSGWSTPEGTTGTNDKGESTILSDLAIKGTWTYTEADKHTVSYKFDGDVPSGVTAPDAQTDYAGTKVEKPEGKTVTTTDEDGTIHTYELVWTNVPDTIPGTSTEITGTWTETTTPAYHITYDWGTDVPASDIPSGYELPTDSTHYYDGNTVTVSDKTYDKIEVKDEYGNVTAIYEFDGWDCSSTTVDGSDITITAKWKKTEVTLPTYSVTYEFTGDVPVAPATGTIDSIPSAPTDSTKYVNNQPYTVDETCKAGKTVTTYDEYGNPNGVYTFSGWDTESGNIPGADVEIKGEWVYTSIDVPEGKVTYLFTGDVPAAPADGTIDTIPELPTDDNTYSKGESYTIIETISKGDTVKTYDKYGNENGVYTFEGWTDPNNGVMSDTGSAVTGTWTFTAIDVPENTVVIPDPSDPDNDKEIKVTDNSTIIVDPNGGNWTHDGETYKDETEVKVTDDMTLEDPTREGYTFTGWETTTNEDGVPVITATWESNDRTVEYTPSDSTPDDNGKETVSKGDIIKIDPNTGVWNSNGVTYTEKTDVTVSDNMSIPDAEKEGSVFTGWKAEKDEDGVTTLIAQYRDAQHTVTIDDTNPTDIPVDDSSKVTINPNGGEWTHDGKTTTEETEIKVTDDITIEDPTREGYTFTGWTKTTDEDGNTTFTAEWEKKTFDVTVDIDGGDPDETITVEYGTKVTINPNGGEWTHDGKTTTDTTEIEVTESITIEDPTREGYTFTGWAKVTDEDGNTTLTAQWDEDIDTSKIILPVVATAVVGGGIATAVVAGGITTAIVAGSVAAPVAIVAGVVAYKLYKDNKADNSTTDTDNGSSENGSTDNGNAPADETVPDTGSAMTPAVIAAIVAFILAAAAVIIIIASKKRKIHA